MFQVHHEGSGGILHRGPEIADSLADSVENSVWRGQAWQGNPKSPDTYNEGKQNSHVIIKQIRHQIEVTGCAQAPGVG